MEMPSFYFLRQVFGTFSFESKSLTSALEMLADNILFETDFPHMASLSPGPASSSDVPAVMAVRALLGQPDDADADRCRTAGSIGRMGEPSRGGVRVLVVAAVFKTDEAEYLGLAGSIPVRLRHPGVSA